jgi:ubiquinol-cytochrome c reductase cytochrome c1 subunit
VSRRGGWLAALALGWVAAAGATTGGWALQKADTDVANLASLQRGARNFVNYCQVGDDLALTEQDLRDNLMFTGERVFDAMRSSMPPEQARIWFGNAPPDLSLIARSRGVDYVYTFLKSFYVDPSRPTGANNALLPNTVMPDVLTPFQGEQRARFEQRPGADGRAVQHLVALEPGTPGEMTAEEFDGFVRDTVTFLEYVSEPAKADRMSLGVWVVLFLLMFTGFAYLLYKEYWKDVK